VCIDVQKFEFGGTEGGGGGKGVTFYLFFFGEASIHFWL
jgi:hypothetical protein